MNKRWPVILALDINEMVKAHSLSSVDPDRLDNTKSQKTCKFIPAKNKYGHPQNSGYDPDTKFYILYYLHTEQHLCQKKGNKEILHINTKLFQNLLGESHHQLVSILPLHMKPPLMCGNNHTGQFIKQQNTIQHSANCFRTSNSIIDFTYINCNFPLLKLFLCTTYSIQTTLADLQILKEM